MTRDTSKTLKSLMRMLGLALLVLPGTALAHPGHEVAGVAHGILHPFTGLDHLLAMVLVGMFAYQLGGRALWLLPLSFLGAMALGGFLGFAAPGTTAIETGIAVSVIALGAAVALNVKTPVAVAAAAVGLLAVFHGFAHGAETPAGGGAPSYGAGFMLGTALLITIGIASAYALGIVARRAGSSLLRPVGTLAAVVGVGFLTGMA